MTVSSISNAIAELFAHSKDTLSIEQLERFKGLDTPAETELMNVVKSLESMAMIHGTTELCNLPSSEDLSCILFGLSDQLNNVIALMRMVSEAGDVIEAKKANIEKTKAAHKKDQT